jgi:hypothetical protein
LLWKALALFHDGFVPGSEQKASVTLKKIFKADQFASGLGC